MSSSLALPSSSSSRYASTNGNNLGSGPGQGPLFEKHEIVGKGAYGAVYRGENRQTGQVVALKVIDLDHPDNEDIQEIQKEVALLSQLRDASSNNITLYYGCWIHEHELWIAMDYASGGSIRTLMKAGKLEERFIVIITREVLIALAYLHKEGIIHRDIKAANILLTQAGRIMICDFGVAAHLAGHSKRSTFIGTPYWMAPEVITEGKLYDTKADLWSLGITVYEMAMGNPPHTGYGPLQVIQMIPRNAPPTLEDSHWSTNIKEFLELCLTIEPSQRPTAEELSKSKWIRSASKVPTTLLKELIMRYGGWINAGNVRTSIIGDVTRRDDTFDFDTAGSWLFDDVDEEPVEGLMDEPYAGTRRQTRTVAKPAPSHLAIAQMFDQTDSIPSYGHANVYATDDGYGGSITIPNLSGSDFGNSAVTLRPNSIALPSFDDEDGGLSAFAPSTTPWYTASASAVGNIEREEEDFDFEEERKRDIARRNGLLEEENGHEEEDNDDDNNSSNTISLPSDLTSPTTVRPSWHGFGGSTGINAFKSPFSNSNGGDSNNGGFSGGFSGGFKFNDQPNPFPGRSGNNKFRNMSEDDDSSAAFNPFGGMATSGGAASATGRRSPSPPPLPTIGIKTKDYAMPSPESPPLKRSASPEVFFPTSRLVSSNPNQQTHPAVPSRRVTNPREEVRSTNESYDGRTVVHPPTSPPATNVKAASRLRANTAPTRERGGGERDENGFPPLPPTPATGGKNVLSFGKKLPFAAARDLQDVATPLAAPRPPNQRRPSALNTAEANVWAGGLNVRGHGLHATDDNLLTPMPTISPASAATTPTASGFPFPSHYHNEISSTPTATSYSSPTKSTSISTSTSGSFSASGSFSSTSSSSFTAALNTPTSTTSGTSVNDSISNWPRGPPIRPFQYSGMKSTKDVHQELERVVQELGDWLASIDRGMGQILDEVQMN